MSQSICSNSRAKSSEPTASIEGNDSGEGLPSVSTSKTASQKKLGRQRRLELGPGSSSSHGQVLSNACLTLESACWVKSNCTCNATTKLGRVRSALLPSLPSAAAGEGAEAHDLQPGEVFRSGRRRWGARSAVQRRGDVFLGACRRGRRRGGPQLYQLRAAWGATGQLSGIWLGLWVSASGGAAQSASIFICRARQTSTMMLG